jgi:hypothetical protein
MVGAAEGDGRSTCHVGDGDLDLFLILGILRARFDVVSRFDDET